MFDLKGERGFRSDCTETTVPNGNTITRYIIEILPDLTEINRTHGKCIRNSIEATIIDTAGVIIISIYNNR